MATIEVYPPQRAAFWIVRCMGCRYWGWIYLSADADIAELLRSSESQHSALGHAAACERLDLRLYWAEPAGRLS